MSSFLSKYSWQFLLLLLLQTLVFRELELGFAEIPRFNIFVYPVIILILPLSIPKEVALFTGFLMGLLVDLWYQTPGIHCAALTFSAFLRPYILNIILDESEIRTNLNGNRLILSFPAFITFALVIYFLHCIFYFLIDEFTFAHFGRVLVRAFFSSIFSFIFAFIYRLIILPR